MGYAEYTDPDGRSWRVWQTRPLLAEVLSILPPDWKDGWLTFESSGEKLRLAPVPPGWDRFSPERLELLRRMAEPTPAAANTHHADAVRSLGAIYRTGRLPCTAMTVHIGVDPRTDVVRMHTDGETGYTVVFPEAALLEMVKHSQMPATETLLRMWLCTIYFDPQSYSWARKL